MTDHPLQVRPATLTDASEVLALMSEFYAEEQLVFDEPAARRALHELLTHLEIGTVLLLESDGAIHGYAALTFGFSLEFHGRLALLDEFYIVPARRGRGLGRQGLDLIAAWARDTGVATLRLEVNRSNSRARTLYQQAGFRDEQRDLFTQWLHQPHPASP